MACEVFVSYTRANNDDYLKRFVEDLSESICDRRGLHANAPVVFFDQHDLELGEEWDHAIVDALQAVKVVIAVASPAYFKSEYCGREWALFRMRCEAAVGKGQRFPPLIKPIIWFPYQKIPHSLGGGQYIFGDPQGIQNVHGFKYLLKQYQKYKTEYTDLIEKLADEIIRASDDYKDRLPELANVPRLKDIHPDFGSADNRSSPKAPLIVPSGPKHVRFAYVAASPHDFGNARTADPYLDSGAGDWKPFFPTNKTRVHRFVQNIVASDELDFTSEEVSFGPNLISQIDDAWSRRQIVVLIIDGWSLQWSQQYRSVLSQLDRRLDYHWCVLVPWNEKDSDAVAIRRQIVDSLDTTFHFHANLVRNPMFYRDNIGSADELKLALKEVLTLLKEEIKKRANVDMPVPVGPSRAQITGPSAEK